MHCVNLCFALVKQDRLSDHSGSQSGMIVLEGDTDVSTINDEENNFEANKKTDEMTGWY